MPTKESDTKSLSDSHPQLAAEWHPTKNGSLTPQDVKTASNKKVWWKCPKAGDHEWMATIASRAAGNGCPCCRNIKVVASNCLATTTLFVQNNADSGPGSLRDTIAAAHGGDTIKFASGVFGETITLTHFPQSSKSSSKKANPAKNRVLPLRLA